MQKALLVLGRSSVSGPYSQTATIRAFKIVYIFSTITKVVHGGFRDFGFCSSFYESCAAPNVQPPLLPYDTPVESLASF